MTHETQIDAIRAACVDDTTITDATFGQWDGQRLFVSFYTNVHTMDSAFAHVRDTLPSGMYPARAIYDVYANNKLFATYIIGESL